jgi:anti-sigma B factor antagonist
MLVTCLTPDTRGKVVHMRGRITRREPGRALCLEGEFDLANASELAAAIGDLDGDGPVDVDMSGVTFMDTAGLHALVRGAEALDGAAPVVLVDPPSRVVRLMELVGVVRLPEIEIRSRRDG